MSVIFICLSKESLESKDKLIGMLSTLFSEKISVDEKKERLEKEHNLPMTKEMEREAAKMCNLSEAIYEEGYEAGRAELKEELKKKTEELESKTEELNSKTEELESKTEELENKRVENEALKAKIIELEKLIK